MWTLDTNQFGTDLTDYAEDFLEELNEVTQYHIDKGDFDPDNTYDYFAEALDPWSEREFMYYSDQDKFVSEVGLDTCLDFIKEGGLGFESASTGISFCYTVCESAFNQCISWEDDDEIEESYRVRRNRARKSMFESRRSANRRGRAKRIR